jgi:hypothetical protein
MMCGKPIVAGREVIEKVERREYFFDKNECAVMFKKLKDVYGSDFCVSLLSS